MILASLQLPEASLELPELALALPALTSGGAYASLMAYKELSDNLAIPLLAFSNLQAFVIQYLEVRRN
jgi:hypothetical protein